MGPIRVGFNPIVGTPAANDAGAQRTQGNMSGGAANVAGQSSVLREKHREEAQRLVARRAGADNPLLDGLSRVASVNQKAKDQDGRRDDRRRQDPRRDNQPPGGGNTPILAE